MALKTKIVRSFHHWISVHKLLISIMFLSTIVGATEIDTTKIETKVSDKVYVNESMNDTLPIVVNKTIKGKVTYYGKLYHNRLTSSGERHNAYGYVAAHKTLPFGTMVKVTLGTKSIVVKINDRGPFGKGIILDLSYQAAKELNLLGKGISMALIEILPNIIKK